MDVRSRKPRVVRVIGLAACGLVLASVPAGSVQKERPSLGPFASRVSSPVAVRYLMAHPEQAPEGLRERFAALADGIAVARPAAPGKAGPGTPPFNDDVLGLPQNEESISACREDTRYVLGGTNDYRGLLDPVGNFTGWHFSTDSGRSLANEGLLPPVAIGRRQVPSGGDPVDVAGPGCSFYAASLNYDPVDPGGQPNGIGVYRSDAATLASCPGGTDPSCWPTRRAVAINDIDEFLDKEWMDVGRSGDAGVVVWVVYSNFLSTGPGPLDFTASINAVRCSADLASCTAPINISGNARDIQFGDVTIGPDGRVYVTWAEIRGELRGRAQRFIHKLRIAPAGSTNFGPTKTVVEDDLPLPFEGFLHANDFRVASVPKNEVAMVGATPRIFLTYDTCLARPLDTICEEAQVKLTWSDDDGNTWSEPATLSLENENYFPTIALDRSQNRLALAWYTHRFDPVFHNRQDVEQVTVDPATGGVLSRQRLTDTSNETEADPILGGFFIGDYFETFAHDGVVWTHFNANYRSIELLGLGVPVPQQDNFLVRTRP